jgi:hypothetical protein
MPIRPYSPELEFVELDITMFCFMPNNIHDKTFATCYGAINSVLAKLQILAVVTEC